eukprot:1204057-Pyramimonas_sp.AAC.1
MRARSFTFLADMPEVFGRECGMRNSWQILQTLVTFSASFLTRGAVSGSRAGATRRINWSAVGRASLSRIRLRPDSV